MSGLERALVVEWMKFWRSPVVWTASVAALLLPPVLAVVATWPGVETGPGTFSAKVRALGLGPGWAGALGTAGQVVAVLYLLVVGVVVAWCFGREFVDGAATGLFAQPVRRATVALAKSVILVSWSAAVTALMAGLLIGAGTGVGLGALPGGTPAPAPSEVARLVAIGFLTAANALPLGWVASRFRGYLPAVGVLFGLVAAAQVAVVLDVGAWVPWSIPGLWAGAGGPELSASVRTVQLLLPVAAGALSVALTCRCWQRAEIGAN